jgi:hypothetical protein
MGTRLESIESHPLAEILLVADEDTEQARDDYAQKRDRDASQEQVDGPGQWDHRHDDTEGGANSACGRRPTRTRGLN